MGTGQTLLTILALGLLGSLFLTNNTNTLDQRQVIESSEWEIMATSLATSLVERATSLSFDQNTISSDITSSNSLTVNSALGTDGAENAANEQTFNDFDDYNGFTKTFSGDSLGLPTAEFSVRARVQYVTITGSAPNQRVDSTTTRTYHKRLTVWVSSKSMRDTIIFQTIYSYWYFR